MASRRAHALLGIGLVLTIAVPLVLVADARAAREAPAPVSPTAPVHPPVSPASPEPEPEPDPAARTAPAASPAPPPASPSEAELTDRVRALVDDDPAAALRAADDCDRRFPSGPGGDERSLLRMRALVHLGQIGDARSEAERFFERFPASPHAEGAYRLTGVHPRPPSGPAPR